MPDATETSPDAVVTSAAAAAVAADGSDAIAWDEPRHATFTWEWDDMHMPRALARLEADYARILAKGEGYRARRHDLPVCFLVKVVNGYTYFTFFIDAPDEDQAAIQERVTAKRREEVGLVGRWWSDRARPELEAMYREIDRLPADDADPAGLAEAWERAWALAERAWEIHFLAIVGPYQALDDLVDFVKPLLDGVTDAEILSLTSGEIDELARVEAALEALVRQVAAEPDVAALLRRIPPPSLDELRAQPMGAAPAAAVDAFLEEHGHLGHMTEDLGEPSWRADPRRLLADLGRRHALDTAASAERRGQRADRTAALLERIRSDLAGRPAELAEFERLLAAARAVGWLTEGHNYWIDRMCGDRLRRFTRRVGARLVDAGAIDDPEDIRHFDREEVGQLLRAPEDRRALVAERAAEHARWSAMTPPRVIGAPKIAEPGESDRFDGARFTTTDAAILRGTGASAGIVRAVARVVVGPADFERVHPGDIVVARASNPGWVPLFTIAGGFVTDTGGVLSHAAVVAREFGVPAVVGTGDATSRIPDGQIIEIDGTTGYVRIG
jgi:phosphohistidine swiveling domain-containing protein